MADLQKALKKLWQVEYSNKPEKMLHCVKGDIGGMTFCGISRKYHPSWNGWKIIDSVLAKQPNLKLASIALSTNGGLMLNVEQFYRVEFWNPICGDMIVFQPTAMEVFLSAVNIGIKNAVKLAQEASGAKKDGLFGHNTLKAINDINASTFCGKYTELEIKYYEDLANNGYNDENDKKFIDGWIARAHAVDGKNAEQFA